MALRLSDDEVGAAVNLAHQLLVADGIEVLALHHPRKWGRDNPDTRPTMDDLYGSAWMAAGAGSVVFFTKGPTSIEAVQAKTPNGHEAAFRFRLDTTAGTLIAGAEDEVLAAMRDAGPDGISTKEIARGVLQIPDPAEAQVEQVPSASAIASPSSSSSTTSTSSAAHRPPP